MYKQLDGAESSETIKLTINAVPGPVGVAALVGVTTYAAAVEIGVPLMAHVLVLKLIPTGNAGKMLQEVIRLAVLPEVQVNVFVATAVSTRYVTGEGVDQTHEAGAVSAAMAIVPETAVPSPAALVGTMLKAVAA